MTASPALAFITADEVTELVDPGTARELLRQTLLDGFDPAGDPARSHLHNAAGELLLMPSALNDWVGVKLAGVAPENPRLGLPRIQAVYVLFDGATLSPRLMIDGVALTSLRTPATSAVAAAELADPDPAKLLVFGSGPQAVGHVVALTTLFPRLSVSIVARRAEGVAAAIGKLDALGIEATAGSADEVPEADLIVTATSSSEPVFDGSGVRDGACVLAIGSHSPARRELDSTLMGRSLVVVEDLGTARRECGDVVIAAGEGRLSLGTLPNLSDLVCGRISRATDRPNVFKGSGMAWQDLAVAAGIAERYTGND